MKYYFCTLFDKNYAHKGLALYNSCTEHLGNNFKMWILCLDATSKEIFEKLRLPNAIAISIEDLDDTELVNVKEKRNAASFAWTSKASLIKHLMSYINDGEILAYLDSDVFLFAPVSELYSTFTGKSLILTPHRFPENEKYKENLVGVFNAGMIVFRKDPTTMQCIDKWRKQCIEWCGDKLDNGRLGDQMYLSEWPKLYNHVLILDHKGVNAGTWNIKKCKINKINDTIFIDEDPLIWFHFHSFRTYLNKVGKLCYYPISMGNKKIFGPYFEALKASLEQIGALKVNYQLQIDSRPNLARLIKQHIIKRLPW